MRLLNCGFFDWGESDIKVEVFIWINWELIVINFYEIMSKKDFKDFYVRVCFSWFIRILEIIMFEEL